MKPTIFIASSVESLSIAYAVQKNLIYDGEVTVWSQGAFNPSNYVMEDLIDTVERSDFGIFVFSPDDDTFFRNDLNKSVRDNVLFEMGLFMGKLGRERVFAIKPDDVKLHIPTDLFGVTIATYENNRQDNNLVAGTGSACNDFRIRIKKLGAIERTSESISQLPTDIIESSIEEETDSELELNKLFLDNEYDKCVEVSESMIKKEIDNTKKLRYKCFRAYMLSKKNFDLGEREFDILEKEVDKEERLRVIRYRANSYMWEELYQKSIEYIDKSEIDNEALIAVKAKCMAKIFEKELALAYLSEETSKRNSAFLLLEHFDMLCEYNPDLKNEEKHKIIRDIFKKYPNNEDVIFKYAYFVHYQINNFNISLYLWNKLVNKVSNNFDYIAHLGNSYSALNFHNHAIEAYEKANLMAEEKAGWIIANIGNFYNNRGVHFVARKYLNKAIELRENDDYSYKRISEGYDAIKNEKNDISKILKSVESDLYKNS